MSAPEDLMPEPADRESRPGASPDDTTAAAPDDGSELAPDDGSELAPDDGSELAPDEASELAPDEASELAPDEASEPAPVAPLTDPVDLSAAIEAILFVVEAPVSVSSIAAALQQPVDTVQAAIEALRAGYDERQAGIELRHVAGGVRLYTRPSVAAQVEVFLQDGQRSRLTQAALETLAVIAYRQPVTRSRVSAIRGVNVDGVVRTLTSRGLIVEVGSDPETGGGLYRTTDLFLERMGLQTLTELPSLAPLLPELDGLDTDEL